MQRLTGLLVVFFFIALLQCDKVMAQDEFEIVRKNIVSGLTHQSKLSENGIQSIQKKQEPDGSWSEINYRDSTITAWAPIKHLQSLKTYCIAINQSNDFHLNENIIAGLRYWLKASSKSKNWWHNEIAAPQMMGEILLLLDEAKMVYPTSLKDSLVESMKKGDVYKQTGANKLDVAIHYLYRACATKNKSLMDIAVQQAFEPVKFTNEEGLQYDYSYLQHGRQLYLSGYGSVFLNGEYKVASWVAHTSFALSAEKLNMLQTYLTQTYLKAIRGHYSDFNIEGRGVSRPNVLDKKTSVQEGYTDNTTSLLGLAKKVNPSDTILIANAIARIQGLQSADYKIEPYHKHFYKADYTLHLRKEYSFNVRTVSDRTKRTEAGNKENLLGMFMPDGATNIQRTGSEYYNIMPVWEWDKIPGITCKDFKDDQPTVVQWGESGSTSFSGGVSDGKYGCSAYDMNYHNVTAKKSWFFFDKEIVCLGAGINCKEDEHITTTLNQCWLKGDVLVKDNKIDKVEKVSEVNNVENPAWVWHDSVGYYFLQNSKAVISSETQKGSWKKINETYSANELDGKVFKLFIDHGAKPVNAAYAYCVLPSVSLQEMNTDPIKDIEVVKNNSSVQAVANKSLQMLQVCLYEAGTIEYHQTKLSSDKPCVLLVKNIGINQQEIWIADPTQKLTEINLSIQVNGTNITKKVELLNNEYKGKSVLVR